MTPYLIVVLAGVVLHTIVGAYTRTPEDEHTALGWRTWHTVILSLLTMAAMTSLGIVVWLATGLLLPAWALLATADGLALAWKIHRHHRRVVERRTLQSLYDQPALGEA